MPRRDTVLLARLTLFIICVWSVVLLCIFSCAPSAIHGPRNPFPKDAEGYNKRYRSPAGLIGINQARCFGGGIGGCGLNGKAEGGPVN